MNKTSINISFTDINTMDKNCSASFSQAYIRNKNVVNKRNEGFGEEAADGVNILNGIQWVDDRDMTDSNAKKKINR